MSSALAKENVFIIWSKSIHATILAHEIQDSSNSLFFSFLS